MLCFSGNLIVKLQVSLLGIYYLFILYRKHFTNNFAASKYASQGKCRYRKLILDMVSLHEEDDD